MAQPAAAPAVARTNSTGRLSKATRTASSIWATRSRPPLDAGRGTRTCSGTHVRRVTRATQWPKELRRVKQREEQLMLEALGVKPTEHKVGGVRLNQHDMQQLTQQGEERA